MQHDRLQIQAGWRFQASIQIHAARPVSIPEEDDQVSGNTGTNASSMQLLQLPDQSAALIAEAVDRHMSADTKFGLSRQRSWISHHV
jgi:hypothetical protein